LAVAVHCCREHFALTVLFPLSHCSRSAARVSSSVAGTVTAKAWSWLYRAAAQRLGASALPGDRRPVSSWISVAMRASASPCCRA